MSIITKILSRCPQVYSPAVYVYTLSTFFSLLKNSITAQGRYRTSLDRDQGLYLDICFSPIDCDAWRLCGAGTNASLSKVHECIYPLALGCLFCEESCLGMYLFWLW